MNIKSPIPVVITGIASIGAELNDFLDKAVPIKTNVTAPSGLKKNPFSQNEPSNNTSTTVNLDEATGLMQSITKSTLTDKIIKKIPSDEYLRLKIVLSDMLNGAIDKKI